jgi:hypothetical protein
MINLTPEVYSNNNKSIKTHFVMIKKKMKEVSDSAFIDQAL